MAITSQITGRPIFGSDPAGFTALVPNNNGYTEFIHSAVINLTFDYTDLTFGVNIPATKTAFLAMVKTEVDTNYLPSVFTDATKSYVAEIVVSNVKLDFTTVSGDRTIWTERTYEWYVQVTVKVNVD